LVNVGTMLLNVYAAKRSAPAWLLKLNNSRSELKPMSLVVEAHPPTKPLALRPFSPTAPEMALEANRLMSKTPFRPPGSEAAGGSGSEAQSRFDTEAAAVDDCLPPGESVCELAPIAARVATSTATSTTLIVTQTTLCLVPVAGWEP
jgi:hypothetical protein